MTRLFSLILTTIFTLIAGMANTAHAIPGKIISNQAPLLEQQLHLSMDNLVNPSEIASDISTNTASPNDLSKKTTPKIEQSYGKHPIHFEPNLGQTNSEVKFTARGAGYTLFLTETEAIFSLAAPDKPEASTEISIQTSLHNRLSLIKDKKEYTPPEVLRMQLSGETLNKSPKVTGLEKKSGISNYYLGNNKEKWQTNVPHFSKVEYEDVYPGIDLVYYGNPQQLEYDFVIAPGADPDQIQLAFSGAENVAISENGHLDIIINNQELSFKAPVIYQINDGKRQRVVGNYVIQNNQLNVAGKNDRELVKQVGFQLAAYDTSLPLVIDPVLEYSTFLGGSGSDTSQAIAVDENGNVYVTGSTNSSDFPTFNATYPSAIGLVDAFITKLNSSGQVIYSTFFGGSISNDEVPDLLGGNDNSTAIATDSSGNAFVTGSTTSIDFPVNNPAYPNYLGGRYDAFVAQFNTSGELIYSTYLGGSDEDRGTGIAVDDNSNSFVTGLTLSADFPNDDVNYPSPAGDIDAFVTQLNNSGQQVYSTLLGGSSIEFGRAIAVDNNGNIFVTGSTYDTDFPTKNAFQPEFAGNVDAFITKFNSSWQIVYSTYLGGSMIDEVSGTDGFEEGMAITADTLGNAYVTGETTSSDFPTVNAFQANSPGGYNNAFVTKFTSSGQVVYSTYLGGNGTDDVESIAVDASGNTFVTGLTDSINFPIASANYPNFMGGWHDGFITQFDDVGQVANSTYLGGSDRDYCYGIDTDSLGKIYVTGYTESYDFPTVNAAYPTYSGGIDAFITKLSPSSVDYKNLSTWDQLNGIEVTELGSGNYQLTHPGTDWPILSKNLPTIPPGAQLKVNFTGSSSPAGAQLQVNPWTLAITDGWHVTLSDTETGYERVYTNESSSEITDAKLRFFFEDSLASGVGQTINVSKLQYKIIPIDSSESEDLTNWEQLNGIEIVELGTDSYQLTHPGTNWPILRKELPTIPAGSQLKVSFTGSSNPAGALLQISPWYLAMTGGGHIYLTETEASYERVYTNETANDITDAKLQFFFEDSLSSGAGQTINISDLQIEITGATSEIKLTPTDDANNRAILDGQLAVSKWEHAFLRFDLTGVQDAITKATLRVYDTGARIPHTLSVGAVEDDNWSEETSTPAITLIPLNPDVLLDSVEVRGSGYVELDVTSFVASQAVGDDIATLELSTVLSNWILLSSKEGTNPSELLIETGSKSWSEPEIIGTGYSPEVFYDETNGNAIAVWDDPDNKVWARRYIPETGWAQPEYIGDGVFRRYYRDAVKAVITQSGNITVAWSSSTDDTLRIMVNQYSPVTGWGDPEEIQEYNSDGSNVLIPVSIDTDATGKIMIITETYVSQNYSFILNAVEYTPTSGWSSPEKLYTLGQSSSAINLEQIEFRYNSLGHGILTWGDRLSQTSSYTIEFRSLSYDKQSGWDENIILVFKRYQDTGTLDPIRYRTAIDTDENIILVIMIEEYNYGTNTVSASISYKKHDPDAGWGETTPIINYESNVNIFQLANNKAGDIILVSNNESRQYYPASGWSDPESFTPPVNYVYKSKIALDPTGQFAILIWYTDYNFHYSFLNPSEDWTDYESISINNYVDDFDLAIDNNGNAIILWGGEYSSSDIYSIRFR